MMARCILELPWKINKRRLERDQVPETLLLQLGTSPGKNEEIFTTNGNLAGFDRVPSDPSPGKNGEFSATNGNLAGFDRVPSDPSPEALPVECLLFGAKAGPDPDETTQGRADSKKQKISDRPCRMPQFRDHIWTYKQMYRAEETSMAFNYNKTGVSEGDSMEEGNCAGLELLQTLFACAEAVACRDARQASLLLGNLRLMASPYGSSLQRVAKCFIDGLAARLTQASPSPNPNPSANANPSAADREKEKLEAQRLMFESCPYVPFGHFAANSAILEAFEGEEAVHVVDLGMTSGLQWRALIAALAERGTRLVRITGVGARADQIGLELETFAASCDPGGGFEFEFEFRAVPVETLEEMCPAMLQIREGEALAVNAVLQLHRVVKESRGSLNAVLRGIRCMSPRVLTLVEQDASHNGPFFLGRFMEALYYYSAIFDSMDAILPRSSTQRVRIEQHYFAEEIKNIVSCEGAARIERHERVDQWRRRMSRAGFQPNPLRIMAQARVWLERLHPCDGYTLAEEKGCLVLGWRGKPIVAASSWKC